MISPPVHPQVPLAPEAHGPVPVQRGVNIWLRRYRRYLPIPLCLIAVIWLRPTMPWGNPFLDILTDVLGISLCLLGQSLRAWAWGSNADVGKAGVRTRGPYKLMQHPLYVGNFLILLGLVVIFNNPWAYPLFLIPFAYLYHVITDMEEQRMSRRFGADYSEYRVNNVPRFWPALSNMRLALSTTTPFSWPLAWRKEYESCCGWLAGVAALKIYEGVFIYGWAQHWPYTRNWIVLLGLVGVTTLGLWVHKSR
jgi:protein-S-isoprenylcysteine O-methyltransferase Ste14